MKHCIRVFRGQGHRLFSVLALLVFCAAPAAGQYYREFEDFGWSRGIDYAVPAILDLDGDGLLDLIVGSYYSGLGRWEQTAPQSESFRRVERDFLPRDRAERWTPFFTDLDGNGLRDILMGTSASYISRYEETAAGSGQFAFLTEKVGEIEFEANGRPWFGDLDGDGRNDLIIGSSSPSTPRYIQRSPNSAEFDRAADIALSEWPGHYRHFLPTDFDGDGILEVLVGIDRGSMFLYRQDPVIKDSFILIQKKWSGIDDAEMAAPAIADIDGDGLLDLFLGTEAGHVRRYEQPSPGAIDGWVLRDPNVLGTWDFGFDNAGFISDLDKDGRLDILRTEVPLDFSSTALPLQHYRMKQADRYEVEYVGVFSGITVGKHESMTVTDLENDGRLDLFIFRVQKGLEHYRQSTGDPFRFDLVSGDFLPGMFIGQPSVPAFTDLDGNGRLDLIMACTDKRLFRYEADAQGSLSFTLAGDPWMRSPDFYPVLCFFDYENDGHLDMLQGNQIGEIRHWRQSAPGSTTFEQIDTPVEEVRVGYKSQPMVFDVNIDGRLDLIVADGAGGISLFIDEGPNAVDTPGEAASASTPTLLPPYPLPAVQHVSLPFIAAGGAPVSLTVFDVYGREITRLLDGGAVREGLQTVSLPVSGLLPGVYFVRMMQASRSAVSRFVVER